MVVRRERERERWREEREEGRQREGRRERGVWSCLQGSDAAAALVAAAARGMRAEKKVRRLRAGRKSPCSIHETAPRLVVSLLSRSSVIH